MFTIFFYFTFPVFSEHIPSIHYITSVGVSYTLLRSLRLTKSSVAHHRILINVARCYYDVYYLLHSVVLPVRAITKICLVLIYFTCSFCQRCFFFHVYVSISLFYKDFIQSRIIISNGKMILFESKTRFVFTVVFFRWSH